MGFSAESAWPCALMIDPPNNPNKNNLLCGGWVCRVNGRGNLAFVAIDGSGRRLREGATQLT